VRTGLQAHLGSRQVARVVYGAILGLSLVVVLEAHPPGPGAVAAWLLTTALAVALAELYSEVVGIETSERHRVTRSQLAHLLDDAAAVAFGVAFPAFFFLLAVLGLLDPGTAFKVAKWSGLGLIGFYGYWAARFAGVPVLRALLQGVLVALIGAGLILLKAFVH
jgi:VIT1/CCC1 family predicted Fe2+/Mn2+ transporter